MKTKINNWLNSKLEPRESEKEGKGIFAIQDISKDEILAVFGGHVMTRTERDLLPEDVRYLALGIDDDWFNHSCNPNAGLRGQIILVAMKDIKTREEITFDYCMSCSQKGEVHLIVEKK